MFKFDYSLEKEKKCLFSFFNFFYASKPLLLSPSFFFSCYYLRRLGSDFFICNFREERVIVLVIDVKEKTRDRYREKYLCFLLVIIII